MATTRHSAVDFEKKGTTRQKRALQTLTNQKHQSSNATRVEKCIKRKIVGTELTRQMTPERKSENLPSQPTKYTNSPYPPRPLCQKTKVAAPTLWGKKRPEGVHHRGPANRYEDFLTECKEEPNQTGNVAGTSE